MNDHGDQLREAFQTHEDQTPDPAEVYARVQDLSRTYKNRRRGAQLAGGAVLGAGLLVGAFQVPALLSANQNTAITSVAPGAPAPAASPSASVTPALLTPPPAPSASPVSRDEAATDAFFAAGYDFDDAEKLAKLWHMNKNDIGAVKSAAGQKLLDGDQLPFAADPADARSAKEIQQVDAFFNAGYDVDDAVELAGIWNTKDAYGAKVLGGKKLLAGETLPIQP